MPKPKPLNPAHFLNRLALDEMANINTINPYHILKEIFLYSKPDELQEMFSHLCTAANARDTSFGETSPGDLLYFSEMLEQLIEACYLIHIKKKRKHRKMSKAGAIEPSQLSVRLSEKEYQRPFIVLEKFFNHASLPGWKYALHNWLEAGLSDYHVDENIASIIHIEKLIEAAYLIVKRSL